MLYGPELRSSSRPGEWSRLVRPLSPRAIEQRAESASWAKIAGERGYRCRSACPSMRCGAGSRWALSREPCVAVPRPGVSSGRHGFDMVVPWSYRNWNRAGLPGLQRLLAGWRTFPKIGKCRSSVAHGRGLESFLPARHPRRAGTVPAEVVGSRKFLLRVQVGRRGGQSAWRDTRLRRSWQRRVKEARAPALGVPAALANCWCRWRPGSRSPVPADLVMLLVGQRVAEGRFSLWVAVVGLEIVAVVGTATLFLVAWTGARRRQARRPTARPHRATLGPPGAMVERRGSSALVVGRATPGLRTVTVVVAGASGVQARRAIPALAIGSSVFLQLHPRARVPARTAAGGALDRARTRDRGVDRARGRRRRVLEGSPRPRAPAPGLSWRRRPPCPCPSVGCRTAAPPNG